MNFISFTIILYFFPHNYLTFFLIIILFFSPNMHMNMKRHKDELLKTHMGTYEGNERGRDERVSS